MTKDIKQGNKEEVISPNLGVYPQKQNGLYMQRIKILGGRISWQHWRKIIEVAQTYTRDTQLHITTRQDIELHNISTFDLPMLHKKLEEEGFTIYGAGGNNLRNITLCSGCDLTNSGYDLMPILQSINQRISSQVIVYNLPRKFKISFSCCSKNCAKPWLNDLGFNAEKDGTFRLMAAGSLGSKPSTGVELYRDLATKDIMPVITASLQLFNEYGNRENRRLARFRHIREKMGDKLFKNEVDKRFRKIKENQIWPDIKVTKNPNKVKYRYRFQLPCGNISFEEAIQLTNTAKPMDSKLRINLEHGLEIYSRKEIKFPKSLSGYLNKPVIVACPGTSSCPNALTDTMNAAKTISQKLKGIEISGHRICISGCPNGCAHSYVADIGVIGQRKRDDGTTTECYHLFTNGGNGETNQLSTESETVSSEDLPETIKRLLQK